MVPSREGETVNIGFIMYINKIYPEIITIMINNRKKEATKSTIEITTEGMEL